MSDYTVRYWRAENTEQNHYKFYESYFLSAELVQKLNIPTTITKGSAALICYGRIGTSGQMQLFNFDDDKSAYSKARGAVWGKVANRDYHMVYDDYLITVTDYESSDVSYAVQHQRGDTLRRIVTSAIKQEKFVSHQDAMTYIEGFAEECKQFLRLAQDGTLTEGEIHDKYVVLADRWKDFQEKIEQAEAAFGLASMRAMVVQAKN